MQNRNYLFIAIAIALTAFIASRTLTRAAEGSSGAQGTPATNRVIRVSGTAVVYGKPDYATLTLGVTKLAPRVLDSKNAADQAMARVQEAIRKAGVLQDDIQTSSYEIYPVQPEGKPRPARQWKVSHQISVKVRNVASVAKVLDAAVETGATDVSRVDFAIEKVLDLRTKARAEAMRVARIKAEELARLGNVRLGEPITISDNSYEGYPAQSVANSSFDYGVSSMYARGPLSGGQIAVNAREDIEFAIQ